MAYTATVTKESVRKVADNIFSCTIRMVVNDGVGDVFDETATTKYNSNVTDMDTVKSQLQQDLLTKWDKFISEDNIFNKAAFDTLISDIQTAANNYMNP